MRKPVLQQGSGDGLCGVYSLANFLKRDPRFLEPDEYPVFWYLLESLQAEGLLQPHYIWSGLETYHLKAVFDRTCLRLDLPYACCTMVKAFKHMAASHFIDFHKDFYQEGGGAVIGYAETSHWFLVAGRSERRFYVEDSGDPVRKQMDMHAALTVDPDGLLVFQRSSEFAKRLDA